MKRYWVYIVLGVFVLVGAWLRLYRADELMVFNGDQGRDVSIVWRMIETGEPTLLGPGSAAGHFRRGPAYYYLLTPALGLTGGEPLSAAVFIALVDLAAIGMLFVVGRALVSPLAGVGAAVLYACAQMPIQVAREFSNPALLPFLTLVMVYALWRIVEGQDRYLLLLAGAWVTAWQLHDQVWLLVFLFAVVVVVFRPRIRASTWMWTVGLSVVMLLPFLVYEATHQAGNLRAMVEYVQGAVTNRAPEIGAGSAPLRVWQTLEILARGTFRDAALQGVWIAAVLASAGTLVVRARRETQGAQVLLLYACAPFLFALWPGPIYGLNIAIVLPVPFLLVGYGVARLAQVQVRWAYAAVAVIILLAGFSAVRLTNLTRGRGLERDSYGTVRAVVDRILHLSAGNLFVFEYIVGVPTEAFASPYLYLFERGGARLVTDARARHVRVYNPDGLGAAEQGTDIYGVRVVAYTAPQKQGQNLLKPVWQVRGATKEDVSLATDTDEIALAGQAGENGLPAIQRVAVEPTAWYLFEFECKTTPTGQARVFVQTLNAQGDVNTTFPDGGGYLCADTAEWTQGAILIEPSPETRAARFWLRNSGTDTVWFRRTQLHLVRMEEVR